MTRPLYEPTAWVLVRAPLLPVDHFLALTSRPPEPGSSPTDPLVRAALSVASPNLLEQLDRRDERSGDGRLAGKLLRYLIRMSTRPTPFGLFAGVELAAFGPCTDVRITGDGPRTRMRPDMGWLLSFVAQLESRPEVRRALRVTTNPAVWFHGGRALLDERTAVDGSGAAKPVDIRATGAVRRALGLARAPIGWRELAGRLLDTPRATEEKVDRMLTQLWQETFLLTELRPPLTHPAPARYVEERLAGVGPAAGERAELADLLAAMAEWDRCALVDRPAAQRSLVAQAKAAAPQFEGATFQVDTALPLAGAQVTGAVGRAAARAAELLVRLGPPPGGGFMESYRDLFVDRYGVDREVPLLELLDPDRGLGPPPASRAPVNPALAARRDTTLRGIALRALHRRQLSVDLDEATMSQLAPSPVDPATAPTSLDLSVFVLAHTRDDLDAGDFRLMIGPNLGGQSAGRNLGRFADVLGGRAREALASVAAVEMERSPGELHAEVVYLPHRGRSANVAIRPGMYEHEVALATTPGVVPERAIPVSELLVGVGDGRLYVRWTRAPGELHVHAGHMLTQHLAPAVCRFLEDVARGERRLLTSFDWGSAYDLPFLPRVEAGRLVLSPAQWRIDAGLRADTLSQDDGLFPATLRHWRSDWMVPDRVYLTAADHRLLLDLDAPAHVEELRAELRLMPEGGSVVLHEPLPGPEHAWLDGPDGHHVPELVVPLVQRIPSGVSPRGERTRAVPVRSFDSDRVRPPGSDWLYVKLYGPPNGQDELLAGSVRSFGDLAVNSGLAERWFFVRYADPKPHLRLRFAGAPDGLLHGLVPRVCAWAGELIADGSCSALSFDTYERELERYGGAAAMAVAEAIFALDSYTVLDLLHLVRTGQTSVDRTTLAVMSVEGLLHGIGLDAAGRLALCRDAVVARHETGDDYRLRKRELRRLLAEENPEAAMREEPALAGLLRARRAVLAPLGQRMRDLAAGGDLTKPYERICQSLVHLHCNRLLGAEPPTEQHVLGLLLRTHEGLLRSPVETPA